MMTVHLPCDNCGSGVNVYPSVDANEAKCDICGHLNAVKFTQDHVDGDLKNCPKCERKDFYQQKDFNRKVGVTLFIIASILAIFTYGISFIVLYLFDFILFKRLKNVAVCYKCNTVFRNVRNLEQIHGFDHEMNDRIVYADHDFDGKPLSH